MAMITNYLLFNHTYLRRLQADSSVDEQASLAAQGIRDWHGFRDDSSIHSMVDSWVEPLLNNLELELEPLDPDDARVHLLCTAWDHTTPVGLCYVAPPGADLDTTTKGRHWMAGAVLAARNWKPAPGADEEREAGSQEAHSVRWVILTNGDEWRLLDAEALRRYEAYLQVNLEELVRDPSDLSALRVFYRCFHRSAFESDSEGESGLDRLLEASSHATKKAEDHLKACVSANEGVMAQLCLGLVESTAKDRFTDEERDAIYRDATYLLYRMLFILYAEARDLLPMGNAAYRRRSLSRLVETAHRYKLKGIPDHSATTLWEQLKQLCNAIYESDERLGIPAYNGGLFDDADKPYLRDGMIADGHLTQALFDLAYQPDGDVDDGYRRIDYRDLSVRHLGSIYEGMIEYKLQIAEETLWARRDGKGSVRFLKTGQDGAPRRNDVEIKKGDVYFSQSPGERKATGTYYTPEYVVDYIVRQTVVRGLGEQRASLEEETKGWLEEVAGAIDPGERQRMQRTADEELLRFVEEKVLSFRVCDPAMGSGHFLVNTAHQITNFIVDTLHLTPWEGDVVDGDLIAWRRRVVERCLYGVDISLMAVELAKLSLWLASVAEGKPLSFLDHHLRQGNSLIGARLEDMADVLAGVSSTGRSRRERRAREAGQLSMLDDPAFGRHVAAATDLLEQISARVAETVTDIKAQAAEYEKVRAELEPYRRLANVWISRYFGVDLARSQFRAVSRYLINGAIGSIPAYERLLEQAQGLTDRWRFFHWELEFPIPVLWHGGFDVVLGNPPYDELSEQALGRDIEEKPFFLQAELYAQAATGRINLYRLFIARAVAATINDGRQSFIVPMSLMGDRFTLDLRTDLLNRTQFLLFEAFPQKDDPNNRVFFDAKLPTCVYVLEKRPPLDSFRVRTHPGKYVLPGAPSYTATAEQVTRFDPDNRCIPMASQQEWDLAQKLATSKRLVPIAEVATPTSGEVVFNKAFRPYLSDDPRHTLVLRGGHVQRYELIGDPKQGTPVYIDLEKYLADAQPGSKAFDHLKPRVVYQESAALDNWRRIIATYLTEGRLCGHKICYFVDVDYDELAFLAVFNSGVPEWRFRLISTTNSLAAYQIGGIPIPEVKFTTSPVEREQLASDAVALYHSELPAGDFSSLLTFVDNRIRSSTANHSDIVHDVLAHLAEQMIDLNKERQRLEQNVDLFRFVERATSCLPLDKALGGPLSAGKMVREALDPSVVHHDIEGLRLNQEETGRWLLEVRAKLRDPEVDWREHQRDANGGFVRQWLPVYRLPLDEATGRFYHYAFANLDGFEGAGKFPGGFTRTTSKKLQLTIVPKSVPVDLEPLAALEAELTEVRRKIRLTDDLIDQIVYRLYGLNEEEIAIVEGRS